MHTQPLKTHCLPYALLAISTSGTSVCARAHATINDYDRYARYSNERQLHEEQLDEETVLSSFLEALPTSE